MLQIMQFCKTGFVPFGVDERQQAGYLVGFVLHSGDERQLAVVPS